MVYLKSNPLVVFVEPLAMMDSIFPLEVPVVVPKLKPLVYKQTIEASTWSFQMVSWTEEALRGVYSRRKVV